MLGIFGDKGFGGALKKPLFAAVYGLFREAEIKVCTGLYFHDHRHIFLQSNDIDLLFAAPPVTMKYNITFI